MIQKAAKIIKEFCVDETGATAIEYVMIAAGISIAIVGGVALIGTKAGGLFSKAAAGF
jgi:pilus assembly protein Flp/PilA